MSIKRFFNTTNESPLQLDILTEINKSPNQKVFDIASQLKTFSASKIFNLIPFYPISSIRRSLNPLEYKELKIIKTGDKIEGLYGRNENQYTLVNNKL